MININKWIDDKAYVHRDKEGNVSHVLKTEDLNELLKTHVIIPRNKNNSAGGGSLLISDSGPMVHGVYMGESGTIFLSGYSFYTENRIIPDSVEIDKNGCISVSIDRRNIKRAEINKAG